MINLKSFYDAVKAANEEVLRTAEAIQAAFDAGTDEGKAEAMAKRAELDAAQAKAKDALDLYNSMKGAAQAGEFAGKFSAGGEQPKAKTVTREEYEAMGPKAKHDFFSDGGAIADGEE
jgi:hypothetical protein